MEIILQAEENESHVQRKTTVSDSYFHGIQIPIKTRYQANARERDRTQNVNTAFIVLRSMIPTEPMDRKLSKIETIRLATKYINHLAAILMTGTQLNACNFLLQNRNDLDRPPNSLCTFCISDYKRYFKSLRYEQPRKVEFAGKPINGDTPDENRNKAMKRSRSTTGTSFL